MGRRKLWSPRDVPEDLWPEILARLPVKTLLRFRCVCKKWRTLIDDPDFARIHLRLFSSNLSESHFINWIGEPIQENKLQVRCIQSLKVTSRLHIPQSIQQPYSRYSVYWSALSSIDGLFMLIRSRIIINELMLWNPATRNTLILPPSPEIPIPVGYLSYAEAGLGFDPVIKDYKHVRVIRNCGELYLVAVYSLATNSWKTTRCDQGNIQQLVYVNGTSLSRKGILFNLGMVNGSDKSLISFDFRSETLASISLPVQDSDVPSVKAYYKYPYYSLLPGHTVVDDDRSVAFIFCLEGSGSVWVLEGLEANEIKACTWSRRYTFSATILYLDMERDSGFFFYLKKNGELLIHWTRMITSYNLKTTEEKDVNRRKLKYLALPYVESLLAIPK